MEKLLHFFNPKDVHMVLPLIIVGRSDFTSGNQIFEDLLSKFTDEFSKFSGLLSEFSDFPPSSDMIFVANGATGGGVKILLTA